MPYSNVTATLTNGTSFNVVYNGSGDFPDASYFISNMIKNGGVWNGTTFYPSSAILQISVS